MISNRILTFSINRFCINIGYLQFTLVNCKKELQTTPALAAISRMELKPKLFGNYSYPTADTDRNIPEMK